MMLDQRTAQNEVSDAGHQQHRAIQRHGRSGEMILAHPACNKWNKRKPEKQMQIRPKNRPVHMPRGMQHMVVIVPVDANVDKAERIANQYRK